MYRDFCFHAPCDMNLLQVKNLATWYVHACPFLFVNETFLGLLSCGILIVFVVNCIYLS